MSDTTWQESCESAWAQVAQLQADNAKLVEELAGLRDVVENNRRGACEAARKSAGLDQESQDMATDEGCWKQLANMAVLESFRLGTPEAVCLPEHTLYWWAFQHIAILQRDLKEALDANCQSTE